MNTTDNSIYTDNFLVPGVEKCIRVAGPVSVAPLICKSHKNLSTLLFLAYFFVLSGCGFATDDLLLARILDTEDARGIGSEGLRPIEEGLASLNTDIQRIAVRGLGRIEQPETIDIILPLLASSNPGVRAEAVNALGQVVLSAEGDEVAGLLFDHLSIERDFDVRGVVARTLGRLRYGNPAKALSAEQMLVQLTNNSEDGVPMSALTGAVMGLESMSRGLGPLGLSPATVKRLEELVVFKRFGGTVDTDSVARVRRTAMLALSWFGNPDLKTLGMAMTDEDPDVRRIAVKIMGGEAFSGVSVDLLELSMDDYSPRVRVEAVRSYSKRAPATEVCSRLLKSATDVDLQVSLEALGLLDRECADLARQTDLLVNIVSELETSGSSNWHRSLYALISLAKVSPSVAAPLLGYFVKHPNPFVRVYVARTATIMGDREVLKDLAFDLDPNVRTAAVQGLAKILGRDADPILIAQFDQDDPFLLMTVAGLLKGTTKSSDIVNPLLSALERISQDRRQTARDPRMALLDLVSKLGSENETYDLEAYLTDYDPVFALRVGEILSQWTGHDWQPHPSPPSRAAVPSIEEIDRLANTNVVLEMERGGEIEIRLLARYAPNNAARFERLAKSGYFDGLTFHRVATNFVIQGGSPAANEFAGDANYTRDELGLVSHWRGTVGTSTRGRDTGDGQIFINLIDNLRLDHNYGVFGEIVKGMDTVDQVAEGDVITRARVK